MPRKNGKTHNGYNGNGYNGASLRHYFIAVATDFGPGGKTAGEKLDRVQRDLQVEGISDRREKSFGAIIWVHFKASVDAVDNLRKKNHQVNKDHAPYLASL